MKKIISTLVLTGALVLGVGIPIQADDSIEITSEESSEFAKYEYDINITPENKVVKANEIVNLTYRFAEKNGKISNKDFMICIDIPVNLELQSFKINGIETDSQIHPLNSKFNRIYLPVKYTQEIVVDYSVKVLDTLPDGEKTWISHGMRDACTGQHVNVDWVKAYLTRFEDVLDGTDNDNNTVEPPVLDGSEDDDMLVEPPVGDGTEEDKIEVEPPVGDGSNEDNMLVDPLPEPVVPLPDKEEGGPTAEQPVLDGTDNDNIMVSPEEVSDNNTVKPQEDVKPNSNNNATENPKTGDGGFVVYGALGIVSGLGLLLNRKRF